MSSDTVTVDIIDNLIMNDEPEPEPNNSDNTHIALLLVKTFMSFSTNHILHDMIIMLNALLKNITLIFLACIK